MWRITAGTALTLGLLPSSALAQVAPTTPSAPPAAGSYATNGDPVPAPAALAPALSYKAVTADRLTEPDDGDWLMFRRTYNGWVTVRWTKSPRRTHRISTPVSIGDGRIEGHRRRPIATTASVRSDTGNRSGRQREDR